MKRIIAIKSGEAALDFHSDATQMHYTFLQPRYSFYFNINIIYFFPLYTLSQYSSVWKSFSDLCQVGW